MLAKKFRLHKTEKLEQLRASIISEAGFPANGYLGIGHGRTVEERQRLQWTFCEASICKTVLIATRANIPAYLHLSNRDTVDPLNHDWAPESL